MLKPSAAYTDDTERRLAELTSPEAMRRQREALARLRASMTTPATEEETLEWREFMKDLETKRPTFR
ncbi:MAG TPA: hypothetical protein VF789_14255 [Thermoanaerobaculia bacterium]